MTHPMTRNLLLASALLLAACGAPDADADTDAALSAVEFSSAVLRPPAPGRDVGAGYFTLQSPSAKTVVGARSEEADAVELHTVRREGGVARMQRVDSFEVGPGAPLTLEPGGNHLMLFGLSEAEAGDGVEVVVEFGDGTEERVTLLPLE